MSIYADQTDRTAPLGRDENVKILAKVEADVSHIPEYKLARRQGNDGEWYYDLSCQIEAVYLSASTTYTLLFNSKLLPLCGDKLLSTHSHLLQISVTTPSRANMCRFGLRRRGVGISNTHVHHFSLSFRAAWYCQHASRMENFSITQRVYCKNKIGICTSACHPPPCRICI
jgi:hypothetical protein